MFYPNNIQVYCSKTFDPPRIVICCELSALSCRNCTDVSHNPPEYNGYKVLVDGGQIVPPQDHEIISEVSAQLLRHPF